MKQQLKSGIYLITNTVNNKEYIGKDVELLHRWTIHKSDLKAQRHHNSHLQRSWNLYGECAFICAIIEYVERKEGETDKEFDIRLTAREASWVRCLDLKNPKKGYNKRDPETGCLGMKHTEETKAKMSASNRSGESEVRTKLSAAKKGKKLSLEHCANLSASHIGNPSGMKGKEHTQESRNKMSASATGKKQSPETIEKRVSKTRGRKHTPETKAKMSEIAKIREAKKKRDRDEK